MKSNSDASGLRLAASCGTVVKAWDPFGDASTYSRPLFFADTQPVNSVVWSPDGSTLAYAGESCVIHLKNWSDKSSKTVTPNSQTSLKRLGFGFEGSSLVTGAADGTVTLWNYQASVF